MGRAGPVLPVDAGEFDRWMRPLGPFETAPELALAVSGGRDSMALALLAAAWAAAQGGRATALTVDHRLRPESAGEARRVRAWLAARGIAHRTLVWRAPKPPAGLQAAARAARYALLTDWCRRHGVLHLALAHQREDQAETFLMRLARGGGLDGLAAMSPCRLLDGVRLLRPLLQVPRVRLAATCAAAGQTWVDDPSNADPTYERTRTGRLLSRLDDAGIGAGELAAATMSAGGGRAALARETAALAARAVHLAPAGYALVDGTALSTAPGEVRRALLGRLLACVGGGAHPPGRAAVARLDAALVDEGGAPRRSLGNCRLAPWRGRLLVAREARNLPPALSLRPGATVRWDRFLCRLSGDGAASVDMLGGEGWRQARARWPETAARLPAAVGPTLPALWREGRVECVAHLEADAAATPCFEAAFRPRLPLAAEALPVASAELEII